MDLDNNNNNSYQHSRHSNRNSSSSNNNNMYGTRTASYQQESRNPPTKPEVTKSSSDELLDSNSVQQLFQTVNMRDLPSLLKLLSTQPPLFVFSYGDHRDLHC